METVARGAAGKVLRVLRGETTVASTGSATGNAHFGDRGGALIERVEMDRVDFGARGNAFYAKIFLRVEIYEYGFEIQYV